MSSAPGGRWIVTFASDIQPGDLIRRDGTEYHVTGRDYMPGSTFRISYSDAPGEDIERNVVVLIWDSDGSVAERVTSLSAAAAMFGGGNSGSHGIAGGVVEAGQ